MGGGTERGRGDWTLEEDGGWEGVAWWVSGEE